MPKRTTLTKEQKSELCAFAHHQTVLTDALLVEKAKVLADDLGITQETLNFSPGWLYKFKNRN
ncbi:13590_t:CDS:2, partial [Dentiscutata heterogama]